MPTPRKISVPSLRIENWRLFYEALSTTLRVTRLVRRGSYRSVLNDAGDVSGLIAQRDVRRVAKAVSMVSRFIPGASCLPQALSVQKMLARRGLRLDISIGVRGDVGEFAAHAWIEDRGNIIIGGPRQAIETYRPITSLSIAGK